MMTFPPSLEAEPFVNRLDFGTTRLDYTDFIVLLLLKQLKKPRGLLGVET